MHESSINFLTVIAICAAVLVVAVWRRRERAPKLWRRLRWASAMLSGAIASYAAFLLITDNVHVVVPGELYRSGQLRAGELASLAKTYDIKSVLNLRGENATEQWYRDEVEAAKALNIAHIDFRMSAKNELTEKEIADLIAIMKRSAKPLLIHCQGGADRTGFAAALYVYASSGGDEELAERQLSIAYGHLAIPFFPGFAMDRTWEAFEDSLRQVPQ
jgi:protein tyrosine/serine phosphatase